MILVIATNNKNKIVEIKHKFSDLQDIELVSLEDFNNVPEVIEDGTTFQENALKKAAEIADFTGLPVMADDSGIVIDALEGRPGVYSARYGGSGLTDRDRNLLVLSEMKDIAPGRRSARFVCVIAIVLPDGGNHFAEGTCEGVIAEKMSGTHGFGYDPIFYLPMYKKTMAEIPLEEKNRISHRAAALDKTRDILYSLQDR